MKTYKERFIEACDQIASEYMSRSGHSMSISRCAICKIYYERNELTYGPNIDLCSKCPIAYNNKIDRKEFTCLNNITYPDSDAFQCATEIRSPTRAKFYRKLKKAAEFLPAKEFQPSRTKSKNSLLKSIVRTIDEVTYKQQIL